MSYATIAQCAKDRAFLDRVTACIGKYPNYTMHPEPMAESIIWTVASDPDIEREYAKAMTKKNTNPGGDETVVTDEMILAAVGPLIPPQPVPPPDLPVPTPT